MATTNSKIDRANIAEALKHCEREALHHINHIQSHGVLLALDDAGLIISQVSQNIGALFGWSPEELLGKPFSTLIGQEQAENIRHLFLKKESRHPALTTFEIVRNDERSNFDAHISRCDELWTVEIELEESSRLSPNQPSTDTFISLQGMLSDDQNNNDIVAYAQIVVRQLRLVTAFDRVMIYQFNDSDDGHVIAESKVDAAESYLGLRFPSSDIPPQARNLYLKNMVRSIADVDGTTVPIHPTLHPLSGVPLDMTHTTLRALSVVHIEYLRNMGVSGSMSISLILDNKLWGMIAMHHLTPKYLSMHLQNLSVSIGKITSLKIKDINNNALLSRAQKTNDHLQALERFTLDTREDLKDLTESLHEDWMELIAADGVVLCVNGEHHNIGSAPNNQQMDDLHTWLAEQNARTNVHIDNIQTVTPALESLQENFTGLMVAPILNTDQVSYIAWFRSAKSESVAWAGNPIKSLSFKKGGHRLSPRHSFTRWVDANTIIILPWTQEDLSLAASLARIITQKLNRKDLKECLESHQTALMQLEVESSRREAELAIANHAALYDHLTQLANRRLLSDRVKHNQAANKRNKQQSALLFIDLDHFKVINDELGHAFGDLLLQNVAERLQASVREGDTIARIGGDEFAVLLEALSEDATEATTIVQNVTEKILFSLNKPYQLNDRPWEGTASVGVTLFSTDNLGVVELLAQADSAMYQAKLNGGNAVRFFYPENH